MLLQTETIREIDVDKIFPSRLKLRSVDDGNVSELMNSIQANGLLQPIIVKPIGDGTFRLVIGAHRLEAFKRLGSTRIPAIVKHVSDEEGFLMNVTENLQRNVHMNPVAEARGYKHLLSRKWTVHEIATKIGKSDSYVCNRMAILNRLHPDILRQLEFPRGNLPISVSHAEHLASINDPRRQMELARLTKDRGLSVHQLERLTKKSENRNVPLGYLCAKCMNYPCGLHWKPA